MKVTKQDHTEAVVVDYPKWPDDGWAKATIKEWENGEGFDISLDGVQIELTLYELLTISTLYQMYAIKTMRP